ncbi:MAG TPA: RNA methyltransferase [Pararhizobium sp.]|nr:RNA methyltransferase [Pararhizobium sp.]
MERSFLDRLIAIDDSDDPRIAGFRNVRERDMRRHSGRFIAEGTVVLRVLSQVHGGATGLVAESILVLENRVAGIAGILEAFPPEVPIHVAPRPVIDVIAGFPVHRGVLALGRRVAGPTAAGMIKALPDAALVLVGSSIANHDNVGALFRNAAVFGVDAAFFDAQSCDPLYRKAIRVSVGGVLRVPYLHGGSLDTIVPALTAEGFELWGLSPRGTVEIEAVAPGRRVALVVGSEGEGLPQALLASMRTARIAQAPGMDSLNVATAAGIALHRFARGMGRIG